MIRRPPISTRTDHSFPTRRSSDLMPVILRPRDFARWLGPSQPADDLLGPAPPETLRLFRVSPRVNSYKVDEPGCSPRSEEHTSELQSLMRISYAVFCLKKKTHHIKQTNIQMYRDINECTIQ